MPRKPTKGKHTKIQIGNTKYVFGKSCHDMPCSTQLFMEKKYHELRKKLERDGYLFIRGVIPKEVALKARNVMLKQAFNDGSIIIDDENDVCLDDAVIKKIGKHYSDGYCVDGITGSETNERDNIDIDAWERIGPGKICRDVYNGKYIKDLWRNLFGNINPLVKQTFLRLMGDDGTIEHAVCIHVLLYYDVSFPYVKY